MKADRPLALCLASALLAFFPGVPAAVPDGPFPVTNTARLMPRHGTVSVVSTRKWEVSLATGDGIMGALHELAHAYHDRFLPQGFANPEVKEAYEKARAGGKYDRVERWHGNGKPNTFERAYAMNNPQKFFVESTKAIFSRNDYFAFTREEQKRHDPDTFKLLGKLWNLRPEEQGKQP
jgi:hypothetical protein